MSMTLYSTLQTPKIIPSVETNDNAGKTPTQIAAEEAQQDKIEFLNLLLTQLTNQNPLDPLDTNEFTAQLTRYSILEQGIDTNEKLSVTNDLLQQNAKSASFSYIGKKVEVQTNMNAVSDNKAAWTYLVEGDASDVTLTVTKEDGSTVGVFEGSISKGAQTFVLDTTGSNIQDGQTLYFSVNAKDGDGEHLNSTTTSHIVVDGIWSNQTESYLTAGELSFKTSDVRKVIDGTTDNPAPTQPTT